MRLLLVDGTNVVMRYAFAMLPDVMSDTRVPVTPEMIERVMKGVEKAIRECAAKALCTHVVVAVDSNTPSWRKAIYPEYKKGRVTITADWINRATFYLNPRGWIVLRSPEQEADDVIATLADRVTSTGRNCAVLSNDSDLLALVGEHCDVWQFGRGDEPRFVRRDAEYVQQKFGVQPGALRLYKSLVGESGDDLPGVRGCGPKKAATLLKMAECDHATLRGLLPTFSGNALEQFDQMLAVVTLNKKVPLDPISPARCAIPEEKSA